MKKIIIAFSLLFTISLIVSCGKDGAAQSPSASGSAIPTVEAKCNGNSCL